LIACKQTNKQKSHQVFFVVFNSKKSSFFPKPGSGSSINLILKN